MDIYDATNHDGLFDILGQAYGALDALNTARATTVPPQVQDILTRFAAFSGSTQLAWAATFLGLPESVEAWSGMQSLAVQIQAGCKTLLRNWARDEAGYALDDEAALALLVEKMVAGGWYVTPSTVFPSIAPGSGNATDAVLAISTKGPDGRATVHALQETIAGKGSSGSILLSAKPAEPDSLSHRWPAGSGATVQLAPVSPGGLVANGGFDEESSSIPGTPSGWIVRTGTPGTTVALSAREVQTVAISGSPTGGGYYLLYSGGGTTRSTDLLSFDASGNAVQTALQKLRGLEKVTVSTAGTSPNYTHTITFIGVAGDPPQLTSLNQLTGGTSPTITHATTTPASPGNYRDRALELRGNGTELTALYTPVELSAGIVYCLHFRAKASGATSGELRLEIVDGIDGSVINDPAGTANSLTIAANTIPTSSHGSYSATFRLPKTGKYYLRVRLSTALPANAKVWIDDLTLAQMTELYRGGPFAVAFAGVVDPADTDVWTITVSNNRAGKVQEWSHRVFDLAARGRMLPITGTQLIPESVIG